LAPNSQTLEKELQERYGPVIGGDDLRRMLGYPSKHAFRAAVRRGLAPVPVFALPGRKGKFALASEIARWISALERFGAQEPDKGGVEMTS